jgi:hypothetical protein
MKKMYQEALERRQHDGMLRDITNQAALRFVATARLELPAKSHTNKTPLPNVLGWWPSSLGR